MSPAPHSTESPGISVERSIVVNVPQARAFDVFVDMTSWWPLATHTIGENVDALLPVLQTYLGHSSIGDVAYYLHLTAESYPDITARVKQTLGDIVPPPATRGLDHGD